jgi:Arc/MetJ family transcription regulator
MRRVDRVDLEDEIGHAVERAVGAQGRNHVVRHSDVHVERRDQLGERSSRGDKTDRDEMIDDPAEADIGQAQSFFPVVRDEQGAGGHDARFASSGQRREIGVDDRMLQVPKRCFGVASGRGWVRDSMRPSPASPARLPPAAEKVACQIRSTRCGAVG